MAIVIHDLLREKEVNRAAEQFLRAVIAANRTTHLLTTGAVATGQEIHFAYDVGSEEATKTILNAELKVDVPSGLMQRDIFLRLARSTEPVHDAAAATDKRNAATLIFLRANNEIGRLPVDLSGQTTRIRSLEKGSNTVFGTASVSVGVPANNRYTSDQAANPTPARNNILVTVITGGTAPKYRLVYVPATLTLAVDCDRIMLVNPKWVVGTSTDAEATFNILAVLSHPLH